ncbi:hypothetical protein TRIP_B350243 [uncultured Desulfatiglans sp.]|nr:hypothetical protein TRIP_B350243 [uncultured Desulfatiglans sp.]
MPCGKNTAAGHGLVNIKGINRLRGGDLQVTVQANVQIDAEIDQEDHFRMEIYPIPAAGKASSSKPG